MMATMIVEYFTGIIASIIALICLISFQIEQNGLRFFLVLSAIGILMYSTADFPLYRKPARQYKEE